MSTNELLSQDEIDALLSGVDSGEIVTEPMGPDGDTDLPVYDFSSQDRIVRGRMPTLELINERFARNLRNSLFNLLRRSPEITVDGIQMTKFGEFIHTLQTPTNLNIVRVNPLRGLGLVVFHPRLVFALVDSFFGGLGRFSPRLDGRDFTATELRMVDKVLRIAFADLREAWQPVMPIEFERVNVEMNPLFANVASPSEVVVVCGFQIDLEVGAGQFQVVMPYTMLEPVREVLNAGMQSDVAEKDDRWNANLRHCLREVQVPLGSTLTTTSINLRDVVGLKPGDVITVDLPKAVVARAAGIPVLRASYGVSRGNVALQIVDPPRRDEAAGFLN